MKTKMPQADQFWLGGLYFCPRLRHVSSEKPRAHSPGSVTPKDSRLRHVSSDEPMAHSPGPAFGFVTPKAPAFGFVTPTLFSVLCCS